MGTAEVEAFLMSLAVEGRVAASTQDRATAALLFLYQHILEKPLDSIDAPRAKRAKRLPVVLSLDEVRAVLDGPRRPDNHPLRRHRGPTPSRRPEAGLRPGGPEACNGRPVAAS